MAERMNEVRIIGNVGKMTKNEKSTYMAVALNESYKKKDSPDWVENTVWVDTICFHPVTEKVDKYGIEVGDCVLVMGKLNQREYEGKRYLQVVAQKVQLIAKPKRKESEPEMPTADSAAPEAGDGGGSKDDLPF